MVHRFHFNVLDAIQNNIHIHVLPVSITIYRSTLSSYYNISSQDSTVNVAMILQYQT